MIDEAKINEITNDLNDRLVNIAQQSQQEYRINLAAGETAPHFGRYQAVGETAQQLQAQAKAKALEDIQQVLEADTRSLRQQRTKRVDPRDLTTVQTALQRQNLTDSELTDLYDEFSDNYQLAQLIGERGKQQGLTLGTDQPAADFDAAMTKAAQCINTVGQYGNDTFWPSVVSDSIAQAYNHTDLFGNRYD